MSTKDELEARAREFVCAGDAVGDAVRDFAYRDDWSALADLFVSFAQQEAHRAGEAKVKEFIRRLKEVDPWVGSDVNIPKVYCEMFPDSDL